MAVIQSTCQQRVRIIPRPPLTFLEPLGFEEYAIKGDGNCLFSALSHERFGTIALGSALRGTIVNHLREYTSIYKHFVTADTTRYISRQSPRILNVRDKHDLPSDNPDDQDRVWNRYLSQMAKQGTFGSHLELYAFCKIFRQVVHVYQRDGSLIVVGKKYSSLAPMTLVYDQKNQHYSSVIEHRPPKVELPTVENSTSSTSPHLHKSSSTETSILLNSVPAPTPSPSVGKEGSGTEVKGSLSGIKIRLPMRGHAAQMYEWRKPLRRRNRSKKDQKESGTEDGSVKDVITKVIRDKCPKRRSLRILRNSRDGKEALDDSSRYGWGSLKAPIS